LANIYKERRIFNNVLYGVVATIVGAVIAGVVAVVAVLDMFSALGISLSWTNWSANVSAIRNYNWQGFNNWNTIMPYIAAIVGAVIVLVVCLIVAAILLRRSLSTLSEKSGTHMFATAGLLFLIGAILTIIGIGVILLWIAMILLAVSFFEMKTQPTQPVPPQPTTTPS
jgi:uncharacterized membrane protein